MRSSHPCQCHVNPSVVFFIKLEAQRHSTSQSRTEALVSPTWTSPSSNTNQSSSKYLTICRSLSWRVKQTSLNTSTLLHHHCNQHTMSIYSAHLVSIPPPFPTSLSRGLILLTVGRRTLVAKNVGVKPFTSSWQHHSPLSHVGHSPHPLDISHTLH